MDANKETNKGMMIRMKIIDALIVMSKRMPEFPLESSSAKKLTMLDCRTEPRRYATAAFTISVMIGLIALPFYSIAGFLLAFAACFLFLLKLPELEARLLDEKTEAEMPVFMSDLFLYLKTGTRFERALELACGSGEFSRKVNDALKSAEGGATIPSAFAQICQKTSSQRVKMAVSQILNAYEHGGDAREIGTFADSMLSLQHHRLRDASSKLGMIGLVFITVSVVAPTFFLIGAVLAKPLFGTEIEPIQFAIIMLVLFPLVSIAILYAGNAAMPAFHLTEAGGRNGRNENGARSGFAYTSYVSNRRIEEIENALPDALIAISTLPKGATTKNIINVIANSASAELAKEGGIMLRHLETGITPKKAFDDFYNRNRSPIVRRAITAVEQITGTGRIEGISSVAESIIKFFEIRRARANILSTHKYTLIFGALLVPAIMAGTISFTKSLPGGPAMGEAPMAEMAVVISAYLIIYSALVSLYIADAEGRRSLALPYAAALSVVSVALFNALGIVWG